MVEQSKNCLREIARVDAGFYLLDLLNSSKSAESGEKPTIIHHNFFGFLFLPFNKT
jgi:hypothetical protein